MSDHIMSIYAAIANVPLMASPHFKLPRQIQLPYDFTPISEDVTHIFKYDFSLERTILAQAAAYNTALASEEAHQAELAKAYEASLLQKRRAEARKIAPGFLDTDRRILTPEPIYSPKHPQKDALGVGSDTGSDEGGSDTEAGSDRRVVNTFSISPPLRDQNESPIGRVATKAINYSEFEQGLAPPDPWDPPADDLKLLQDVLQPPQQNQQQKPQSTSELPHYISHQSSYPSSSPSTYHSSIANAPLRTIYSSSAVPTVSLSSPPSRPPYPPSPATAQHPLQKYQSSPQLPARPPKDFETRDQNGNGSNNGGGGESKNFDEVDEDPVVVDKPEVEELMGMGFTREKSLEALKKCDYDVSRATNYLLDEGA